MKQNRKGVFLVLVDSRHEFQKAIEYASLFANAEGGYVALLSITEETFLQNWGTVEECVKTELRTQAEELIWDAAGMVIHHTNKIPLLCIEEGNRSDVIIKTIKENKDIVALVLASSPETSSISKLISYFSSSKGLARLPVPLMIVPGHLDPLD